MQSTVRFIRRNLLAFSLSLFILFIINLILFTYLNYKAISITASIIPPDELSNKLIDQINQNNSVVVIDKNDLALLEKNKIWAMVIDDKTGKVIWSKDLPKEIPIKYSIKDVALFTRYYLKDYPVFTYINNKGLLVLGYPKDSYGKIPTNAFHVRIVQNLPRNIMYYLLFNLLVVFILYMISKRKLLQSINPITNAICRISNGEKIQLKENGDLLDIKIAVNKTSKQLLEKDSMRTNWIAGISHDIRTPLSLIIGYIDRLSQSKHLDDIEKKELELIQSNSVQIQNLVNDLNLTSRLEYNLVPMEKKDISIVKILREVIVDYMNHEIYSSLYDFNFISDSIPSSTMVNGDEKLLERAFRNLILNSIKHNPQGCQIQIEITMNTAEVNVDISDNGVGVSEEKLKLLNYSVTELIRRNTKTERSHGLGLLIVKQIIELHEGSVNFRSVENHGFKTRITLPLYNKNKT